jgi:hypothetical protein
VLTSETRVCFGSWLCLDGWDGSALLIIFALDHCLELRSIALIATAVHKLFGRSLASTSTAFYHRVHPLLH